MRRTLVLVAVLFAVFWQGIAGASPRSMADAAEDAAHAALHWGEVGHHHDDDGSYTEDDSIASVLHVALDGSLPPMLQADPTLFAVAVSRDDPPSYLRTRIPFPVPDPLQRPPSPLI